MSRQYLLIAILLFFIINPTSSQNNGKNKNWISPGKVQNQFRLFENEDIIDLSITFDLSWFLQNKPEKNMDAILSYRYSESDSINFNIKLRARGNFRYRNCAFPPIRLDFDNVDFGYSDLNNIEDIKLVTHCDSSDIYEQYMLREYLTYKLLNIVTENSFRVRLLRIRYYDIGSGDYNYEQYAFALEPMEMLLDRLGAVEIEDTIPVFETVDRELIENISIFQYMIGNSDWSLPILHNLKLVKFNGKDSSRMVVIPFDFDYCGFVNAHYAMARTDLGIESVRDRVYLGPCIESARLGTVLDEFESKRDKFLATIRNFDYLDRRSRRDLEKFIISFFNEYRNNKIEDNIRKNCINK